MSTRRPRSVRTRVSVACAGVAVGLVIAVAALVIFALTRREYAQLDRRLDALGAGILAVAGDDLPGALPALDDRATSRILRATATGLVVSAVVDGDTVASAEPGLAPSDSAPELSSAATDRSTVQVAGADYRLHVVDVPGQPGTTLVLGLPAGPAAGQARVIQLAGAGLAILAALLAGGLGWLAGGRALRPLAVLSQRVRSWDGHRQLPTRAELVAGAPGTAAETAALAQALADLLARISSARADTEHALHSARDFAAAADHELRTPLTALRTDLEVLAAHPDLPITQRLDVLREALGSADRVTETLLALRALAEGDLATAATEEVELVDLLAAARERAGTGGRVRVGLDVPAYEVVIRGSRAGLAMAVTNLVDNAVRHGPARHIELSLHTDGAEAILRVDDDGTGVPDAERSAVLGRFVRGSGVRGPGSGLGLALVAQQAAAHGGSIELSDSPTGGLRVELRVPLLPAAPGPAPS